MFSLLRRIIRICKDDDKLRRQNKERDEELQTIWNIIESLRQQTQENTKRLEQLSKDAVV